jgi:PAS domain S-box-containing protein
MPCYPYGAGVKHTGVAFSAKEHELMLVRNGVSEMVFVDFVYEPIKQVDGTVNAIMVLAIEVTEKAIARRSIEEMEERVRLAVEAAGIGTFDLDIAKRIMVTTERFNTIFGFDHSVSWDKFVKAVHPDDMEIRAKAHRAANKNGKLFYELRIVHPDQTIHWVRAQGKVYFDKENQPVRLLGTLLDITMFKRLEQQKDDFISIASHELKTPITSLKASLQLLERMKDDPSPVMLPKLIDQSNKSMQKISTLVNDLLNVSRTNEQKLQLNKTHFNIADLLDSCCTHVRVAGKYTLTVEGDKQLEIFADEHAIDQVAVNLVNNAVKYAPDSLEIILTIENLGDAVKIAVKDNGPGIPADKLPRLFDRYYQADNTGFQSAGLGLGLYICSEIVKRHNGNIGVDSELGKGSTFWFILPLE